MSKAEERALEKYPIHSILIVPARRGGYYADNHLREGFIEGYHQAEKDLELTVDDIMTLDALLIKMRNKPSNEDKYQEVLKRFKDFKERKQQ